MTFPKDMGIIPNIYRMDKPSHKYFVGREQIITWIVHHKRYWHNHTIYGRLANMKFFEMHHYRTYQQPTMWVFSGFLWCVKWYLLPQKFFFKNWLIFSCLFTKMGYYKNFFVYNPILMKFGEIVVSMSTTISPNFIKIEL